MKKINFNSFIVILTQIALMIFFTPHVVFSDEIERTPVMCMSSTPDFKVVSHISNQVLNQTRKIKFLLWNVKKFSMDGVFQDFENLSQSSDLMFVQESVFSSQVNQNIKNVLFNFNSVFFKSFCSQSKSANGVQIFSKFNIENSKVLVSEDKELGLTPKTSGLSYITLNNRKVLLINTHALNFNFTGVDFEKQISQILEIIKTFNGPIIWGGDFNTWNIERLQFLIKETSKLGLQISIPQNDPRFLKLDHIFTRGFKVNFIRVMNDVKTSDHSPIYFELETLF